MTDKEMITQKQADAIEIMLAKGAPISEIVERHIHKDHILVNGFEHIQAMPTHTLIRALYIGYEVKESPEEKLREYYKRQSDLVVESHRWDKPTTAIKYVLECLNIHIEGVN